MYDNNQEVDYSAIAQMLSGASAPRRDRYFEPGLYLVEITNLRFIRTREAGDHCAVIETSIIDGTNSAFYPNSDVTYFINLSRGPRDNNGLTSGMKDLRGFIDNMFETKGAQLSDADMLSKIQPDPNTGVNPLSGRKAIVEVTSKPTRSGGLFNVHNFKLFVEGRDTKPNFAQLRGDSTAAVQATPAAVQAAPAAVQATPAAVQATPAAVQATPAAVQPAEMNSMPTQQNPWAGNMPTANGQIPF